jgi:archaellum biogenesis ATPase FlaH
MLSRSYENRSIRCNAACLYKSRSEKHQAALSFRVESALGILVESLMRPDGLSFRMTCTA